MTIHSHLAHYLHMPLALIQSPLFYWSQISFTGAEPWFFIDWEALDGPLAGARVPTIIVNPIDLTRCLKEARDRGQPIHGVYLAKPREEKRPDAWSWELVTEIQRGTGILGIEAFLVTTATGSHHIGACAPKHMRQLNDLTCCYKATPAVTTSDGTGSNALPPDTQITPTSKTLAAANTKKAPK